MKSGNRITLCRQCFDELDPSKKSDWRKVFNHSMIIDGIINSVDCDKCQVKLTDSRIADECIDCLNKYNEFQENPDLPEATHFDDTVLIIIEMYSEDAID